VKEQYSYICPDLAKEFAKYDANPEKQFKTHSGVRRSTGEPWTCDVGYERFLVSTSSKQLSRVHIRVRDKMGSK
jgi:hypothetical protein